MKLKFYSLISGALLLGGTSAYAQLDPPCAITGAYVCDNFDAYTVGDHVAPGATWWSTWSGTEGGSEDGYISDEYAYSGSNSMLISEGGTNDQILKLGNQTSGEWLLQWMCYIPDGKTGYYNIQESESPGVAWNLELLYGLSAVGVPSSSGEGVISIPLDAATFEYPVDEWFMVKHVINLDDDLIDLYIDGVLIYSDVYTGSIGAIDFYSIDANNRYYIDDVLLIDASLVTTYYLDDDGDGYGDPDVSITVPGDAPDNYVADNTDCDDLNPNANPGETEICNGVDDDCVGGIDDGVLLTFYVDSDGDDYGNPDISVTACEAPVNYVSDNTDCDDTNGAVYPGATEVANGIDDDCDNDIDEGLDAIHNITASSAINIYPSPAAEQFTIELVNTVFADQINGLEIYTAAGQMVYSDAGLNTGLVNINSSAYSAGMYVCKITTATAVIFKQLTIQRD